jgi:hypothetical protein
MKFKTIPRKLRIFDFDDTLVTTDAKIKVPSKNLSFSTSEFAKYKVQPDDVLDFSDFRTGKLFNPKPTAFFRTAFKKIIIGDADIMILTARPNTEEIKEFLADYVDIDRLIIVGGARTPEMKKNEIAKVLDDYDEIKFFDDSVPNIMAVRSLKSPKIKTQIVKK